MSEIEILRQEVEQLNPRIPWLKRPLIPVMLQGLTPKTTDYTAVSSSSKALYCCWSTRNPSEMSFIWIGLSGIVGSSNVPKFVCHFSHCMLFAMIIVALWNQIYFFNQPSGIQSDRKSDLVSASLLRHTRWQNLFNAKVQLGNTQLHYLELDVQQVHSNKLHHAL